ARRLRSEGAASGRAGARATWTAAIAAADIEDARRARSPHGRRQALHCDCGAEDAGKRIEAGPDLADRRSLGWLSFSQSGAWMRARSQRMPTSRGCGPVLSAIGFAGSCNLRFAI